MQFSGLIPTLYLDSNILSIGTTTEVKVEEEVTKIQEVYLYNCSKGELEEIQVIFIREAIIDNATIIIIHYSTLIPDIVNQ